MSWIVTVNGTEWSIPVEPPERSRGYLLSCISAGPAESPGSLLDQTSEVILRYADEAEQRRRDFEAEYGTEYDLIDLTLLAELARACIHATQLTAYQPTLFEEDS